jgi:hypothetical protein
MENKERHPWMIVADAEQYFFLATDEEGKALQAFAEVLNSERHAEISDEPGVITAEAELLVVQRVHQVPIHGEVMLDLFRAIKRAAPEPLEFISRILCALRAAEGL